MKSSEIETERNETIICTSLNISGVENQIGRGISNRMTMTVYSLSKAFVELIIVEIGKKKWTKLIVSTVSWFQRCPKINYLFNKFQLIYLLIN